MQRAWARAAIHLNVGDVEAATAAGCEAADLTDWARFGSFLRVGGAPIYATVHVPTGWGWYEAPRGSLLVSEATMTEFCRSTLLSTWSRSIPQMRNRGWRVFDVESWRIHAATERAR
jgi:hypothetical protein